VTNLTLAARLAPCEGAALDQHPGCSPAGTLQQSAAAAEGMRWTSMDLLGSNINRKQLPWCHQRERLKRKEKAPR